MAFSDVHFCRLMKAVREKAWFNALLCHPEQSDAR